MSDPLSSIRAGAWVAIDTNILVYANQRRSPQCVEPVGAGDILEALRIQKEAGLLTNDALLLASSRRLNCEAVASADRAIAQAPGFSVYSPNDLRA